MFDFRWAVTSPNKGVGFPPTTATVYRRNKAHGTVGGGVFLRLSAAVPRIHAVQRRVRRGGRREPALLPAPRGGGGGDLRQHGRHQRAPSALPVGRSRLHPPRLPQGADWTRTHHI